MDWINSLSFDGVVGLIVHVGAAGLVTVHTLLRKRDVPASIGWIGMAWLAPALGALLYFGFGINRVHRRARRLMGTDAAARPGHKRNSERDPDDLDVAISAITRNASTNGKVMAQLFCGDAAYPVMIEAINQAKSQIRLATYIFRADEVGDEFIAAIAAAQQRGVAVAVLIDGFGGGFLTSPAFHRLQREGVEAARFLHSFLPWRMAFLNLRLHKKILSIDGRIAFVGGLNIGRENVLSLKPKAPVSDHHFQICGPIINQIDREFDDDWQFATGKTLPESPRLTIDNGSPCCLISSGPDQETDLLVLVLLSAINKAKTSIKIATPYFLPDEQIVTALRLASLRGVRVDIVLPESNNHPFVQWAAQAHIRPLIESGCKIWYNPPPFDHSKLMVVDSLWSFLGSANWDARSLRLNFELTIAFQDAALAANIAHVIDSRRGRLLSLSDLDSRPILVKLRDSAFRLALPYI